MPYVSFISALDCLAAAAGLVTPLRTCPFDRIAPSLSLRHRQAPKARPPAPDCHCQLTSYTSRALGMEMWMRCRRRWARVGVEPVVQVSQASTCSYSVATYRIRVGDCSFDIWGSPT